MIFILMIVGWVSLSGCSIVEIIEVAAEVELVLIVPTTGWSPLSLSVSDHALAQHIEAK